MTKPWKKLAAEALTRVAKRAARRERKRCVRVLDKLQLPDLPGAGDVLEEAIEAIQAKPRKDDDACKHDDAWAGKAPADDHD